MRKTTATTALVPLENSSTELALPSELVLRARHYAAKSRAPRTIREYAGHWAKFEAWCAAHGRDALPCSPETLTAYMTWLAEGGSGKQLSISSIYISMCALKFRHESAGERLDTQHPLVSQVWGGIRREIAARRSIRQVRALLFRDLRDILDLVDQDVPRDVRDGALLALGCAGALRRSELIGLDWARLGTHEDEHRHGFLTITAEAMTVTLMTSKTSQDMATAIVIPRDYSPLLVQAVERWIALGQVEPGTALFRGVSANGRGAEQQSGYPGVSWRQNKWRAQTMLDGRAKHIGYFEDAYQAYLAYCAVRGVEPGPRYEGAVAPERLCTEIVPRIVRHWVAKLEYARADKKGSKRPSKEEIAKRVKEYSGHSLRAGYATSAALQEVPQHRIKQHTRHKTDAMVSRYIREVDLVKNSGLKGVGF